MVIATGRYFMQTKWMIKKLGFKGILVSNDGAITLKTDTKEIIHEFSYSIEYYQRPETLYLSLNTHHVGSIPTIVDCKLFLRFSSLIHSFNL